MVNQVIQTRLQPRPVTIRDVASKANVSIATVSAALSGNGTISDARRETVRHLAEKMNYKPRIAAQLMRAKKTGSIGIILAMDDTGQNVTDSGFHGPMLSRFFRCCEHENVRYHIEEIRPRRGEAFKPPHQLAGGLVDGVLICGYLGEQGSKWLDEQNTKPVVFLGEPAEYSVLSAADNGVYEAAKYLAACGHRRIAFAGGQRIYSMHRLAHEGFLRAVKEFRLEIESEQCLKEFGLPCSDGRKEIRQYAQWAKELLSSPKRPTAIIGHGMKMARAVIYAAVNHGLGVPDDLSVIGAGTPGDAEKSLPCATNIEPDYGAIVDCGMRLLRRIIAGKQIEPETYRINPKLVIRDTTGQVVLQS